MDFLKQCPLLICVLLTSLLIPWELLKKEDDSQKAAPTTVAKITTVATEAATTAPPANDGATPDGSETAVSGSDLGNMFRLQMRMKAILKMLCLSETLEL